MKMQRLLYAALAASVLMTVAACGDSGTKLPDDEPVPLPTDPNDPNNATKDTDCDGLSDKIEFDTDRGNGQKTHPGLADTDRDGLPDGLELGIDKPVTGTSCTLPQDASAALKTSPVNPDTDGDGLKDGVEDANKNGKADTDETHPLLKDSDCDGLLDGPASGGTKGEDQNANGTRDSNETDPRKADTDEDGLLDGVELGATTNLDPTTCTRFVADSDPASTTDPTRADSDGDGVSDGAEDNNQNGQVDSGELNPGTSDATGPAGQVCTASNLRPVMFRSEDGADLKIALPPTFTEVSPIKVGDDVRGVVGYDSEAKVGFLAFRRPAPAAATDALGDEEELRPSIQTRGALTNRTAQRFMTWDGHDAVQAFYDQEGATTDLKRRVDQLVETLVPGSEGRLSAAAAGVTGIFRLQTLFVHRSAQSVVVLIAVTRLDSVTGANRSSVAAFSAKDLSDGSALAQFGEPTSVQCERFQLTQAKVDFLFVVDDSGSMASSQDSLAKAAESAVAALDTSSLDWRMGMVTSSYHISGRTNSGKLRHFTRNLNKMTAWLTEGSDCVSGVCSLVPTTPEQATCPDDTSQGANGGCWVSTGGSGSEGVLGAARLAIKTITAGAVPGADDPTKARTDAGLVVIILADADDQTSGETSSSGFCGGNEDTPGNTCQPVSTFTSFFGNVSSPAAPLNPTGKLITVHGIVCPSGSDCGCDSNGCEFNPKPVNGVPQQRHAQVVNASGGVLGSISDLNSIKASMDAIIADAIGNAGYRTLKPPIGASIKVAVESVLDEATCSKDNLPRSTVNGFDFDGSARTISFFGACRPKSESVQAAVSYQYWVDAVKDPNGGVPCENDPDYSPTEDDHCSGPTQGCNPAGTECICKPDCGGTCTTGFGCNMELCACEPIIG
ncbi:MAG: thrombospondin [Myxococcaceae bacterium]|nr:thrombospondin [Myxococcaceae bacterium]